MDTSESEDCFESADEDFLSGDEEDSSTDNQESQIESKKVSEGVQKVDNGELDCNKNAEKGVKNRTEFASLPSRVECCEPDVNDGKTKVEACTEEKTKNLDNVRSKREGFAIPPTRVDCWEPGVNDTDNFNTSNSNIKRESNKRKDDIESEGTRPDRSGYAPLPTRVECWEPDVNDTEESIVESCKVQKSAIDCAIEKSSQEDSEIVKSVFTVLPKRTECWFPEVNLPTKQVETETEPVLKQCSLPPQQRDLLKASQSENFVESEKRSLAKETSHKEMVEEVTDGVKNVSVESGRLESKSEEVHKESKDEEEDNMWDKELKEEDNMWDKESKDEEEENMWDKEDEWESWDKKEEPKPKTPVQISNDDMWGDDEDWGDFDSPKKETPKQETAKEDKDKDDLWGDDDDWGDKPTVDPPKQIGQALENLTAEDSSWSGWGNWGIGSVLSTAANLTSTVSQGLTTVIGVPDPEELARQHKAEKEREKDFVVEESVNEKQETGFGYLVNISKITKLVESTSTKVISGGLDTLETIGKKTMEVLQENDPGLKKKRAFLKIDQDGPVLSQILREAKEKAEEENKELEKLHFAKKANYEMIFDDYQGLVHLEALEMLSRQCDIKLQSLLKKSTDPTDLQETLDQVKELCELPEEDDEETLTITEIKEKIDEALTDINIPITYVKLLSTWEENEGWIAEIDLDLVKETEVHQQAIETLAQLTAICVEQYHKAGELLLIKEHRSTADEADSLSQLTSILSTLISLTASKFSEILGKYAQKSSNKEETNGLITNIFLEAANSSRYIKDAFQLLIPVLQVGAV